MTTCPAPGLWLQLVDGQLTEERAIHLRDHARSCSVCGPRLGAGEALIRRVAAPIVLPVSHETARSRVLQRISASAPTRPSRLRFGLAWLSLPVCAVAAAVVLVPRPATHQTNPAREFTARGGSAPSLARDVGVRYYATDGPPRRLSNGAHLGVETPITTAYVNLTSARAYLLALAVDSAGKVQWLQPGPDAGDPVTLQPHDQETPLRETVVLDEPALGPLHLVTVVSTTPIAPVLLRGRTAKDLTREVLSRALPGSHVTETDLTLEAQAAP